MQVPAADPANLSSDARRGSRVRAERHETMEFFNGHHTVKVRGNTRFPGPLTALPLPDGPPDTETAVQAMYDDGYVIFPGLLNANGVALLRARMDAMGSRNDDDYVVEGWCYNKHIASDFSQNPDLLDYIDLPGVVDVLEVIHGGDAHLNANPGPQVIGGSSWITGAGRDMGIHTDYQSYHLPEEVHEAYRLPIYCTTLHIYLNDLTPELGPTILIPGSHRAGRPPEDEWSWKGRNPQAALVKAGDALLFRNDIWHGAWKNTHPTERRYMMQVHYAHGSFGKCYPSLRYPQLYAPEVLAKATPRQRRLLGERPPRGGVAPKY